MLSQKAKDFLKSLNIDAEKLDSAKIASVIKSLSNLSSAISDAKEVDTVEFSKLDSSVLKELGLNAKDFGGHTPEELEEAKANTKKVHEVAFSEITAKQLKEEYGIKIDSKNLTEVIKAINAEESRKAVEAAKIPVDKQIAEKEKELEILRGNYIKKELEAQEIAKDRDSFKNKHESFLENQEFDSLLPANRNPLLRSSDYRQRLLEEKGILSKKIDGVWVACNPDGSPMKDALVKNIPLKTKIDEVFKSTPDWVKQEAAKADEGVGAGFGTGSSGTQGSGEPGKGALSSIKSTSDFKAYCAANKIPARKQGELYTTVQLENKDFNPSM